jgi:sugar phosphate permease
MLTDADHRRLVRLRWTAFGIVGLTYILSYVHRMAPAAIAADLQQAFSATAAELGLLASMYFYVYTLMQVPTGVLADTLGVRRIVTIGGFVTGVGSLVFALAPTLTFAGVGRLLVGFGVSFTFVSMLKLNSAWFHDRHFATATGLTVLVGNLGATLASTPLVWLLQHASWRQIFSALGVISLALGGLTWTLVRNHPGEAGLPSMRELDGKEPHPPHTGHWWDGLVLVARNRNTWPGFWPAFGVGGTFFAFAGLWGVPYLMDVYGMSRPLAAWHTTLFMLGFAFGSFGIGLLSDRLGRRKPVLIGGTLVYVLCWLPLWAGLSMRPAVSQLLLLLLGLSAGGFTLVWAVAKEVNPPALAGSAISIVNVGPFLGAALLQPLVGVVMDWSWDGRIENGLRIYAPADHQWGMSLIVLSAVVGLIGATRVRETYARQYSPGTDSGKSV